MIDIDLTYGIQSVWKEDEEYQTTCLRGILSAIRRINDTDIAKLHEDYLKEIGAFLFIMTLISQSILVLQLKNLNMECTIQMADVTYAEGWLYLSGQWMTVLEAL